MSDKPIDLSLLLTLPRDAAITCRAPKVLKKAVEEAAKKSRMKPSDYILKVLFNDAMK